MENYDFSFAGINASSKNFTTQDIYIPPLPEQEETTVNIPKIPGLTQLFKKFTKRVIKIKGILDGLSPEDLIVKRQDFTAFLFSESDEQLICNNQPDRYFLAQNIRDIDLELNPTFAPFQVPFNCNDPFGYAILADNNNQYNVAKNYQWPILNSGQYWAFPVITITFNQEQSHIYLRNTSVEGCRFDISKSFVATDVLEISSKDMTIKLNGEESPAGFGDGGNGKLEFILLKTGNNIMEVGTDDASLNIDININFRKVYL